MLRRTELSIGYSGLLYAGRLPLLLFQRIISSGLHTTVCGFVSVCPLHKVSSLPQMLMGQIAQNRCYTLARLIKR